MPCLATCTSSSSSTWLPASSSSSSCRSTPPVYRLTRSPASRSVSEREQPGERVTLRENNSTARFRSWPWRRLYKASGALGLPLSHRFRERPGGSHYETHNSLLRGVKRIEVGHAEAHVLPSRQLARLENASRDLVAKPPDRSRAQTPVVRIEQGRDAKLPSKIEQ